MGGDRALLCFGGGGRGVLQIAAAECVRACAGVCYKGRGTSRAQLSPSAPHGQSPDCSPQAQAQLSQAAGC